MTYCDEQSRCWLFWTISRFRLLTIRPNGTYGWSKSNKRLPVLFAAKSVRRPFVTSAAICRRCVNKVIGCLPLWLPSLQASHYLWPGHLGSYLSPLSDCLKLFPALLAGFGCCKRWYGSEWFQMVVGHSLLYIP